MTTALAVLVVVLASCGGDGPSLAARRQDLAERRAEEARDAGRDQQADALADGEVTQSEYDGLMASYVECYEAAGVQMADPVPNPANPRVAIAEPADFGQAGPFDSDELARCATDYLGVEELLWEAPAAMDPALADAVGACLADVGRPLGDGDDDLLDMVRSVGESAEATQSLVDCVITGAGELFPELPISVSLPSIR